MTPYVVALNIGSSTFKFAAFEVDAGRPRLRVKGRIAAGGGNAQLANADGEPIEGALLSLAGERGPGLARELLDSLERTLGDASVIGVGHRIVHGGGHFDEPVRSTPRRLAELEALAPLAPLHQSQSLAAVRFIAEARPGLAQILTFDTAFHRDHEPVVSDLGLPEEWTRRGLRRFGFHGLSYEYVSDRMRVLDPRTAIGRVVVAHLGSGASLCAMLGGRSIDSTMGATPLDGLLMATRCGTLDPGVLLFMQQAEGLSVAELTDVLYRRSGLLGVSGTSGDMRELLADKRASARRAIDLFVFRAAREVAALSATLGGLDGLVFTAGIGENEPTVRAEICARLAWLGVEIDPGFNRDGQGRISPESSSVAVWVIPTDEEMVIARHTCRALSVTDGPAGAGGR